MQMRGGDLDGKFVEIVVATISYFLERVKVPLSSLACGRTDSLDFC